VKDLLEKVINIGLGVFAISREKVEKFVNELAEKGEISKNEVQEMVNKIMEKGEEQRKDLNDYIAKQVENILNKMNLATKSEVISEERIREIIREELSKQKNE
jgi:polyhydroxyalkanoate synthesis regulator phasin